LVTLAADSTFWKTAFLSLARMFCGIAMGAFVGVFLAVLTAASGLAELLLSPAVKVVRAVPVASFILLVLLWSDRDWVPVVISALMVIPVVWAAVRQGIDGVDRQLLELARVYRFDRWKTLRLVWLPAVKAAFTTGLATAMGLAWKSGVAAEVLCIPKWAIGAEIYHAKLGLEIPDLFASTIVVVTLSLLLEKLLRLGLSRQEGGATL
jgi:NitT/TauT family transport system permease protein